jgi:hypothetical protein
VLRCYECPTNIEGPRRLTCSDACRKRRERRLQREREARFRDAARELLLRQTEAILLGDLETLAEVQREAVRLFG